MLPNVSILIVGRNAEKDLPKLFRSISKLAYPKKKFEIIFIDDGSKDNTAKIAEQFGAKVIRFDQRQGRAKVRNVAIKHAKYSLIAWIDTDCEIRDRYWLQNMLKYLKGKVVGVAGPHLKPEGSLRRAIWYLPGMAISKGPRKASWAPTTSSLFKKKPILEVGGYDEKLVTAEDLDLCWRLSKKGYDFFWTPKAEIVHNFRATWSSFVSQHFERGVCGAMLLERHKKQHNFFYNLLKFSIFFFFGAIILLYVINPILLLGILFLPLIVFLGIPKVSFLPPIVARAVLKERSIKIFLILVALGYIRTISLLSGIWYYFLRKI